MPVALASAKTGSGDQYEELGRPPGMEFFDVRNSKGFARSRPVIECAQCGEHIYVPEWTEYLEGGRVRHLWCCDACRYAFETTVRFAEA